MQNFSSLSGPKVAEKFVVGRGVGELVGSKWLLCLISTLVALSRVELGLGFDNKNDS